MLGQRRQARGARLRGGVDRQEIVVALKECTDSVLVLGPQNGARDVNNAPAAPYETQRLFQRLVLILGALL
jgi:hypothetical protein